MFRATYGVYQVVGNKFDGLINKYKEDDLLAACREGHLQAVQIYVSMGREVDALYENKKPLIGDTKYFSPKQISPLCMAASKNHKPIVEYLIKEASANVNFLSKDNTTALYGACAANSSNEIVELLLENGANPEICRKTLGVKKRLQDIARVNMNSANASSIDNSLRARKVGSTDEEQLI